MKAVTITIITLIINYTQISLIITNGKKTDTSNGTIIILIYKMYIVVYVLCQLPASRVGTVSCFSRSVSK